MTLSAERILTLLEHAGDWLSGEELARRLGVSRAAIAKHVATLRDAGHVIRSRTRKGHRLELKAETLSEAKTAEHLQTKTLGRNGWKEFAATGSTNTEAIAWALSGAPEGAVVTAETQTGGRGRKGHEWFSSPRGLAASIILRPGDGATEATGVTGEGATRAALEAMRRAIAETAGVAPDPEHAPAAAPDGKTQRDKQPNDLYIDKKKVCGILAEEGWRGDEPDWLVVGVGCNVSVLPEEFPEDIKERVTSLYAETGRAVSKNKLFAVFLHHFEALLTEVRHD